MYSNYLAIVLYLSCKGGLMDANKLLNDTANNINKELSEMLRSKQSIVSMFLSDIETLSSNGISYRVLLEKGDIPIALKHFQTMIYIAKKKRSPNEQTSTQKPNATSTAKSLPETQEIDLVEWKMIMPDIAEKLVQDIVKQGYEIEEVKSWIKEKQLPNSSALRRYFTALKQTTN
jgi:hypothetical protein